MTKVLILLLALCLQCFASEIPAPGGSYPRRGFSLKVNDRKIFDLSFHGGVPCNPLELSPGSSKFDFAVAVKTTKEKSFVTFENRARTTIPVYWILLSRPKFIRGKDIFVEPRKTVIHPLEGFKDKVIIFFDVYDHRAIAPSGS
jgi:hypothetical protein